MSSTAGCTHGCATRAARAAASRNLGLAGVDGGASHPLQRPLPPVWFTDNNSGGSCCPDWRQVCEGVKEGTTCLDARAQGSALGLFVAAALTS